MDTNLIKTLITICNYMLIIGAFGTAGKIYFELKLKNVTSETKSGNLSIKDVEIKSDKGPVTVKTGDVESARDQSAGSGNFEINSGKISGKNGVTIKTGDVKSKK